MDDPHTMSLNRVMNDQATIAMNRSMNRVDSERATSMNNNNRITAFVDIGSPSPPNHMIKNEMDVFKRTSHR